MTTRHELVNVDEQAIVTFLQGLIDIPSVTGSERAAAEFVVAHLRELGFDARLQEIEDGRANAIGTLRGSGGGPSLVFTGHLDTATSGRPDEDLAGLGVLGPGHYPRAYVKDGHVYGLGAFNMKGGVAAATTAVAALRAANGPLKGDVSVVWVSGESESAPVDGLHKPFRGQRYRGGGVGTRYYVTHGPVPDLAVVCEPSGLHVTNADAGYLFVKVTITTGGGGLMTHLAGAKALPSGAVSAMTRVVDAIEAWRSRYVAVHRFETGLGVMEPSVGIGAVEAGMPWKPTYRPPVANVYVVLRLTPAMQPNATLAELRVLLDELCSGETPFAYELEVYGSNVPSTMTPADHPLIQTALRVRERVLGKAQAPLPGLYYTTWNDSNVFRQHGIPAVILGPSWDDDDPGAANFDLGQHVAIAHLKAAAQMYAQIAGEFCGAAR